MRQSHFRYLLLAILAFWSIALAACADQWAVGLDAVSWDGRWATLVEHTGDPPTWRLILLDLYGRRSIILADDVDPTPESSMSPDNRYTLFSTPDGWILADMIADQNVQVAKGDESVQFLPNGELLVILSTDDGLSKFLIVPDLTHPQQRVVVIDNVTHIFRGHYSGPTARVSLTGFPGIGVPMATFLGRSIPRTCATPLVSERALWTTVDSDGVVSIVIATREGLSVNKLAPKRSVGLTTLLNRQLTDITAALRGRIRQEAVDAGKALSEDELERQLRSRIKIEAFKLNVFYSALLARASPDGSKLFYLRVAPREGMLQAFPFEGLYTLYYFDLTTEGEPHVLSSETEWMPSFSFSPDGRQILFESNRDSGRSLYLAKSDGTNIRQLPVQDALNPCWY